MRLTLEETTDNLHPFALQDLEWSLYALIADARKELEEKVHEFSDKQSATWGFFPELNPDLSDYPACAALQERFNNDFLALPTFQDFDLRLAFIRLATSEPQSAFGGLHIDASAGIDHLPPKNRQIGRDGILRVLINLYHEPRELQYCAESIESLRRKDINIPEEHYEIVQLPEEVQLKSYSVKPVDDGRLHGVMFESSSVLHAGRTNQKGHFLLSYGGYANKTLLHATLLK